VTVSRSDVAAVAVTGAIATNAAAAQRDLKIDIWNILTARDIGRCHLVVQNDIIHDTKEKQEMCKFEGILVI
jgi:hypothetical protein